MGRGCGEVVRERHYAFAHRGDYYIYPGNITGLMASPSLYLPPASTDPHPPPSRPSMTLASSSSSSTITLGPERRESIQSAHSTHSVHSAHSRSNKKPIEATCDACRVRKVRIPVLTPSRSRVDPVCPAGRGRVGPR